MARTSILADNFKHIIKAADERMDILRNEYYNNGNEDIVNALHYWEGKLDGMKLISGTDDDFFLLQVIELLKLNGFKDAARYINSLIER